MSRVFKSHLLEKFFTKKRIYFLILLWILANLAFNIGPWSIPALNKICGNLGIPDMMLSYDIDKIRHTFDAYGAEGLFIYSRIQLLDFIYPLIYGSLMLGLLVRVGIPNNFKSILAFPFVIVVLDFSENILIRILMNHYPDFTMHDAHLANLAAICTNLKWSFIILVLLNIIVFWIWNLLKKK